MIRFLLPLLCATFARAEEPRMLLGASAGQTTLAPDGLTPAEKVFLDDDLVPALLATPVDESVRIANWPLAPGARGDVVLTRRDAYAPDAILYAVDGKGLREIPRSSLVFFQGQGEYDQPARLLISVDSERRTLHGYAATAEGWTETRPTGDAPNEYLTAPLRGFTEALAGDLVSTCGQSSLPEATEPSMLLAPEAITTLHRATLAVDTDNELMQLKFQNNTTSATNYVATLVSLMSVIYERDLLVRLLQGTTFLRVSTTPDPYTQSGTGDADSAKLNELRTYWMANYGAVSRAAVMMLSGKQASATRASGIAYVDSLCSTSIGYSFSQVFKYAGSTAASDTFLVGHEVGHSFGSRHTHCYLSPTPIDICYNGEGGCYSGATLCPAVQTINGVTGVRGTIMSYCHTLSGCSASNVFHPRTVEILNPIIQSRVGVCVFPVANPKEASPAHDLTARRGGGGAVTVTYGPACGATQHTVYAGNLDTLRSGGIAWSQRTCAAGTSGSLTFTPSGNVYFVVVGNNGSAEGSYGLSSSAERPAAGAGGSCSYTQNLSGTCP